MLDKHVYSVYEGGMAQKVIKVQHVRGQCLITIPKKMAKAGLFDIAQYAHIYQNAVGELFIRRMVDDGDKAEGLQANRTFFDRST